MGEARLDRTVLEASLRSFLREELLLEDADLDARAELVSTGLIDSADLVRLATHLEREVGISVPDQDISAENFDSIHRILDYCAARLED